MELAMITFEQVGILFLLIFAGFVAVKTGAIKPEGRKVLSDLLVFPLSVTEPKRDGEAAREC